MIVGCYNAKKGTAIVLPLEMAAEHFGVSVNQIRNALNGKACIPGEVIVKLPSNSVWRHPEEKK